jgi:hypothetical protein
VTACRLGEAVLTARYPGPISTYTWRHYVFPAWLVDMVNAEDLDHYGILARAMLQSIRDDAVPHRMPLEWTVEDELRFGS